MTPSFGCSSTINISRPTSENGPFDVVYLHKSNLNEYLKGREEHILAVIGFGNRPHLSETTAFKNILVALNSLDKIPVFEVWTSQLEVCHWYDENASFSFNSQILLGTLSIQEANKGTNLEELSYLVYKKVFQYSKDLGYPHLLRAWNYIPRINKEQRGLERYKRFCMGRHAAFSENYTNIKSVVPAGSAIGTSAGPLQVIFLGSTTPGKNIENPLQISAYDYPIQYGPVSPSFSRATLYPFDMGAKLFIAGTASIVGHSSCHLGKPSKQARETVRNILALIEHTKVEGELLQGNNSENGFFKVYVRQRAHLEEIKDELKEHLRDNHKVIFLEGDICRKELLLEIEGILTYGY